MHSYIKKNRLLVFIIAICFTFVISVLTSGSNDFVNYYAWYQDGFLNRGMEPLFRIIASFYIDLNIDYLFFFITLTLISLLIKLSLLKKMNNSLCLFLCISMIYLFSLAVLHEVNEIRAAIAIAFGFYFLQLMLERKNIMYCFLILSIAIGFHYSASFFFFSGWINRYIHIIKVKSFIVYCLCISLISIIMPNLLSFLSTINQSYYVYFNVYSTNSTYNVLFSFTSILALAFSILNLIMIFLGGVNNNYKAYCYIFILGFFISRLFSFSLVASGRIYELFIFSSFLSTYALYSKEQITFRIGSPIFIYLKKILRLLIFISFALISLHQLLTYVYLYPSLNYTKMGTLYVFTQ